jgi:hypothetical protein
MSLMPTVSGSWRRMTWLLPERVQLVGKSLLFARWGASGRLDAVITGHGLRNMDQQMIRRAYLHSEDLPGPSAGALLKCAAISAFVKTGTWWPWRESGSGCQDTPRLVLSARTRPTVAGDTNPIQVR